jgi:hypothetical protein
MKHSIIEKIETPIFSGLEIIREMTAEDEEAYDNASRELLNQLKLPYHSCMGYASSIFRAINSNPNKEESDALRNLFGEVRDRAFGLPVRVPHSDNYYGYVARLSEE